MFGMNSVSFGMVAALCKKFIGTSALGLERTFAVLRMKVR